MRCLELVDSHDAPRKHLLLFLFKVKKKKFEIYFSKLTNLVDTCRVHLVCNYSQGKRIDFDRKLNCSSIGLIQNSGHHMPKLVFLVYNHPFDQVCNFPYNGNGHLQSSANLGQYKWPQ